MLVVRSVVLAVVLVLVLGLGLLLGRLGVGVSGEEKGGLKRLGKLGGLVGGVVKMSGAWLVDVGVGQGGASSGIVSLWRRLEGVADRVVFWALRGVAGGGMSLVGVLSATFESSSSSLESQS